jgi:ribosomal protein S18 acetylase RimI-like enzyme
MRTSVTPEIRDLRLFDAAALRPLLEVESGLWRRRLDWEYLGSAKLLLEYLDARALPGFVAVEQGEILGYVFCVYEENKGVIGNVFAAPRMVGEWTQMDTLRQDIERLLLEQAIALLTHSPGVERVETQLLLHEAGEHAETLDAAGFRRAQRLYLQRRLRVDRMDDTKTAGIVQGCELRPWRDGEMARAAQLIVASYRDHPDSRINDQYRTTQGAQRFLHNIVRYPGCGTFEPEASLVAVDALTGAMAGVVLSSRISSSCGHITQICVAPEYRRRGLADRMLRVAMNALAMRGLEQLTLTVTASNQDAIRLYLREGFQERYRFDAAVWARSGA